MKKLKLLSVLSMLSVCFLGVSAVEKPEDVLSDIITDKRLDNKLINLVFETANFDFHYKYDYVKPKGYLTPANALNWKETVDGLAPYYNMRLNFALGALGFNVAKNMKIKIPFAFTGYCLYPTYVNIADKYAYDLCLSNAIGIYSYWRALDCLKIGIKGALDTNYTAFNYKMILLNELDMDKNKELNKSKLEPQPTFARLEWGIAPFSRAEFDITKNLTLGPQLAISLAKGGVTDKPKYDGAFTGKILVDLLLLDYKREILNGVNLNLKVDKSTIGKLLASPKYIEARAWNESGFTYDFEVSAAAKYKLIDIMEIGLPISAELAGEVLAAEAADVKKAAFAAHVVPYVKVDFVLGEVVSVVANGSMNFNIYEFEQKAKEKFNNKGFQGCDFMAGVGFKFCF